MSKNIYCDLQLEPSHGDGSNEGLQDIVSLRNKENYLRIIKESPILSGALPT